MNELAIRTLFLQAFKGNAGKRALEAIHVMTDYDKPIIAKKADGSLDHEAMLYNEGRRSVWAAMRTYIDADILAYVEIDAPIERAKKNKNNQPTKGK